MEAELMGSPTPWGTIPNPTPSAWGCPALPRGTGWLKALSLCSGICSSSCQCLCPSRLGRRSQDARLRCGSPSALLFLPPSVKLGKLAARRCKWAWSLRNLRRAWAAPGAVRSGGPQLTMAEKVVETGRDLQELGLPALPSSSWALTGRGCSRAEKQREGDKGSVLRPAGCPGPALASLPLSCAPTTLKNWGPIRGVQSAQLCLLHEGRVPAA